MRQCRIQFVPFVQQIAQPNARIADKRRGRPRHLSAPSQGLLPRIFCLPQLSLQRLQSRQAAYGQQGDELVSLLTSQLSGLGECLARRAQLSAEFVGHRHVKDDHRTQGRWRIVQIGPRVILQEGQHPLCKLENETNVEAVHCQVAAQHHDLNQCRQCFRRERRGFGTVGGLRKRAGRCPHCLLDVAQTRFYLVEMPYVQQCPRVDHAEQGSFCNQLAG